MMPFQDRSSLTYAAADDVWMAAAIPKNTLITVRITNWKAVRGSGLQDTHSHCAAAPGNSGSSLARFQAAGRVKCANAANLAVALSCEIQKIRYCSL